MGHSFLLSLSMPSELALHSELPTLINCVREFPSSLTSSWVQTMRASEESCPLSLVSSFLSRLLLVGFEPFMTLSIQLHSLGSRNQNSSYPSGLGMKTALFYNLLLGTSLSIVVFLKPCSISL